MSIIEKLGITKAPWVIDKSKHPLDAEFTSIGEIIASDEIQAYNPYIECSNADAQLIASAPEMLEALIEVYYMLEVERGGYQYYNELMKSVIQKATNKTWEEIKELISE